MLRGSAFTALPPWSSPEKLEGTDVNNSASFSSKLFQMDAFFNFDGLLKVGERLKNTSLLTSLKCPVFILRTHPIAKAIIAHCHEKTHHQEKGLRIDEIRANEYWIHGTKPPFNFCGVDCFGLFFTN